VVGESILGLHLCVLIASHCCWYAQEGFQRNRLVNELKRAEYTMRACVTQAAFHRRLIKRLEYQGLFLW